MMLTSRQQTSSVARVAPDFTLTNTSGASVTLSALRGKNVLLYFKEGAQAVRPAWSRWLQDREGTPPSLRQGLDRPTHRDEHQGPDHH